MPTLRLSVEPEFCGPFSVGTVQLIKELREHLGVGLAEAHEYVSRCVDGEQVEITVSNEKAELLLRAIADYPPPAKVSAETLSD